MVKCPAKVTAQYQTPVFCPSKVLPASRGLGNSTQQKPIYNCTSCETVVTTTYKLKETKTGIDSPPHVLQVLCNTLAPITHLCEIGPARENMAPDAAR